MSESLAYMKYDVFMRIKSNKISSEHNGKKQ